MEVRIISKEMVKPSSQEVYLWKPFTLSLLDQFVPPYYTPLIYFYPKPRDSRLNTAKILVQLKKSLSKALNQFYPLSGRTIDNRYIGSYDKGVPYVEASVKGCLSDYVGQTLHSVNQLLPCQGFCSIPTSTSPQIAIQVNIFDCGGIAIAFCSSHKVVDGTTASAFFKSWVAFNRGSNGEIPNPDMFEAGSRLFPPLASIPQNYLFLIESLWFHEGWHTTRRFVFDDCAIATLKHKAKSKRLEHPTRSVVLTAFLWKYAILTSRSASGVSKPSILSNTVNLRPRMKPILSDHSIGNLHCSVISTYDSVANDIELHHLAYLVREAIDIFNDQLPFLQGGKMLKFLTDQYNQAADVALQGGADLFDCSSLLNTLDGNEADFGWGPPTSLRLAWGESRYYSFSNSFYLKAIEQGRAIEAVITLDAKAMDILEHDSEFLAFASPASSPYPNQSKI